MSLKNPNTPAEYFLFSLIMEYENEGRLSTKSIISALMTMFFIWNLTWDEEFEASKSRAERFLDLLKEHIDNSEEIMEEALKKVWTYEEFVQKENSK